MINLYADFAECGLNFSTLRGCWGGSTPTPLHPEIKQPFNMSTKISACQNCAYAILISHNDLQDLSYLQARTSNLDLQTPKDMHLILRKLLLNQLNQLLTLSTLT